MRQMSHLSELEGIEMWIFFTSFKAVAVPQCGTTNVIILMYLLLTYQRKKEQNAANRPLVMLQKFYIILLDYHYLYLQE